MEIKITDHPEGTLIITDEELDVDTLVDVVITGDTGIKAEITVGVTELLSAVQAFQNKGMINKERYE